MVCLRDQQLFQAKYRLQACQRDISTSVFIGKTCLIINVELFKAMLQLMMLMGTLQDAQPTDVFDTEGITSMTNLTSLELDGQNYDGTCAWVGHLKVSHTLGLIDQIFVFDLAGPPTEIDGPVSKLITPSTFLTACLTMVSPY